MKWMSRWCTLVCIVALACSCKERGAPTDTDTKVPPTNEPKKKMTAVEMIDANEGKIQIVLLGMPGCPGTEEATPKLIAYAKIADAKVVVARVDVPPTDSPLKTPEGLDPSLLYAVDTDRKLASRLEFFFYPTLFILDGDLTIRYHGDADLDAIGKMVNEMGQEDPSTTKKIYTVPLPKVGEAIPKFELPTLAGDKTNLAAVTKATANLVLFCNTTCPYSRKAAQSLADLKKTFAGKSLSMTIINYGQAKDVIKGFYADVPDCTVMVDQERTISRQTFKVMATPFFFVLDKDGKILARQPFTMDRAKSCLGKALGVTVTDDAAGGFG